VSQDLYNRIGLASGAPPDWLRPERDHRTLARLNAGWDRLAGSPAAIAHASQKRKTTLIGGRGPPGGGGRATAPARPG
jgi:hypothetical protein